MFKFTQVKVQISTPWFSSTESEICVQSRLPHRKWCNCATLWLPLYFSVNYRERSERRCLNIKMCISTLVQPVQSKMSPSLNFIIDIEGTSVHKRCYANHLLRFKPVSSNILLCKVYLKLLYSSRYHQTTYLSTKYN